MIFGRKSEKEDGEEVVALKARIEELEKENRRLRSTLEFYAKEENWTQEHKFRDLDDATIFASAEPLMQTDVGEKARKALALK
jgi:hypothetical protein